MISDNLFLFCFTTRTFMRSKGASGSLITTVLPRTRVRERAATPPPVTEGGPGSSGAQHPALLRSGRTPARNESSAPQPLAGRGEKGSAAEAGEPSRQVTAFRASPGEPQGRRSAPARSGEGAPCTKNCRGRTTAEGKGDFSKEPIWGLEFLVHFLGREISLNV